MPQWLSLRGQCRDSLYQSPQVLDGARPPSCMAVTRPPNLHRLPTPPWLTPAPLRSFLHLFTNTGMQLSPFLRTSSESLGVGVSADHKLLKLV